VFIMIKIYIRFGKIYPGLHKMINIINELKELQSYKFQKNNIIIKNIIEGDWLLEYLILNINVKSLNLPFNNYYFSSFLSNYKKIYPDLKPHFFISFVEALFSKFVNYLWYAINESGNKNEITSQLKFEQINYINEVVSNFKIGNI